MLRSPPSKVLTYVKRSTLPNDTKHNLEKGLFAKKNIPNQSVIVEFIGKVTKNSKSKDESDSIVMFEDGSKLVCPNTDKASLARDPIKLPKFRRQLIKSLNSDVPFYDIHDNARINADIFIDNERHRVFLIASSNIKKHEEIFCHFGFPFWFTSELSQGFLQEEEIEENGFPETIHQYPAFISYLKKFYRTMINLEANITKERTYLRINLLDATHISLIIPNYKNMIQRETRALPKEELEEIYGKGFDSESGLDLIDRMSPEYLKQALELAESGELKLENEHIEYLKNKLANQDNQDNQDQDKSEEPEESEQ